MYVSNVFVVLYNFIFPDCTTVELSENIQHITSPNYPNDYDK